MKVLYIGNKLAASGRTPTTVDTLGKQFEEFLDVVTVSDKFNKLARFVDMCTSVFKHKNADYVIINAFCIIISSKRSIEVHFPIHENVNHSNYINYNNKNI